MQARKLRVGVVGCGSIATRGHLPVYSMLRNVEIASVCDKNRNIAGKVAKQFAVREWYGHLTEMLAKGKHDIIDICTPPQTHESLSNLAMNAGCHVLVEKPMALSVSEADGMIRSSKENDVKLCVVHQNLFNPVVIKAKHLVEEGVVGDLIDVSVGTFLRRDNEMCLNSDHWCHTLPGGIFFEILPHPIYLIEGFLHNINPICVLSKKLNDIEWMRSDELRVVVNAENGIGLIVASCNSPIHADTLNIVGTKMALQAEIWGRTIIKYKPRTQDPISVGFSNLRLTSQLFNVARSTASVLSKMIFGKIRASSHHYFISEFIESIRNDTVPPVPGEQARENLRILEAICKKAK